MNKYMGFYELKALSIPTVPWKLFSRETTLDEDKLWTVRVATAAGDDFNLPRAVGVDHAEARRSGMAFLKEYGDNGIVIYYPYFIAQKSGVLDINSQRTVVEAVDRDLWNLVTHGRKNVTVIIPSDGVCGVHKNGTDACCGDNANGDSRLLHSMTISGDSSFLSLEELRELMKFGAVIRGRFRDDISEGRSILAEWSYAYDTDPNREPKGDRYLVFYELRGIRSY
jgi:hypothetical protein